MKNSIIVLLKQYGFKKGILVNEYSKPRYISIIGKDNTVSICHYTANYNRFLWSKTFSKLEDLEYEFKTNH